MHSKLVLLGATAGVVVMTLFVLHGQSLGPPPPSPANAAGQEESSELADSGDDLRFALAKVIMHEELAQHRRFAEYLGRQVGRPFRLLHLRNYAGINRMIRDRQTEFAFICGGPYVTCQKEGWAELVAIPQIHGGLVYYSNLVTSADAPFKSIADFKGRRYAFTDPLSNSGCIVPSYLLLKLGTTPEAFFSKRIFTHGHNESIKAVRQAFVDGASVDSYIWERALQADPALDKELKVIQVDGPYGFAPVVATRNVAPDLLAAVRRALCSMHETEEGKQVLKGFGFERFQPGEHSLYDGISMMMDALDNSRELPDGQ